MKIIPAIDIKDGKCVRLTQGNYNQEKIYNDSPVAAAKSWVNKGATKLHLVDLDGARQGEAVNYQIIKEICRKVDCPIQIGGGIRLLKTMRKYMNLGVDSLIVSTVALKNEILMSKALKVFGSDHIVVSIDIKNGAVAVKGWLETTEESPEVLINRLIKTGVKRIIFTDISSDGMLAGPDLTMVKKLNRKEIELIAAGGISSTEDLKQLEKVGVKEAVVGKALYEGEISL